MQLHIFQHVSFEGPGYIAQWAADKGHRLTFTHLHAPAPAFPDLTELDVLVVLGGEMSVHDEALFPWLREEKQFIRRAIDGGLPVLGICLGAQLVAEALGATVSDGPAPEIGFFPIHFSQEAHRFFSGEFPASLTPLHWHGEIFSLPPGARLLASSAACTNQAFSWQQRVIGLQFHPEVTAEILAAMLEHEAHDLVPGEWVQSAKEIAAGRHLLAASHQFLDSLLTAWAASPRSPQAN
ncbi:hypothetical protein PK28_08360 [Hymenobacter sp. DG25B]|uniref:type 1 glutamine amidotransferase n=1 Tax=Hymenobacter sp. DG25B TaxID=1385664 RepID=UPI000540F60C|nr:type 1 glutamine amidotransferase [Hymenobacter sp. DG25B]AIZ63704.1 hypothetical protein PK28_08360 [Hymenobacter sp. DG25B]